ncbi:MAG: ribonuclease III [Hyphomicrobiales bacterium]|nr:ribonuclease III [Hyphomicrobiales bacterium]MDE2115622.1 ribonuclease III [Hyphomicrobiales bacterium]
MSKYAVLEKRIGYGFKDVGLIDQALTHVSFLAPEAKRALSYQRLEFLGDRVLGLVVAEMLNNAFPGSDEGELSRRLADLVRKESCAEVADDWNLGHFIRLGDGEIQAGGARKAAILADVCESVIGAVFLDGGYSAARKVVSSAWKERMDQPRRPLRDAKTALQEWAQARGLPAPRYVEISRAGPAHAPLFVIGVQVEGFAGLQAEGGSKRIAEQAVARQFLQREGLVLV